MTQIAYVVLVVAALGFLYRGVRGPALADRVIASNGLVLVGMGALATRAAHTGDGAFLPTLIVIALVGPIANGMIARYIERRAQ